MTHKNKFSEVNLIPLHNFVNYILLNINLLKSNLSYYIVSHFGPVLTDLYTFLGPEIQTCMILNQFKHVWNIKVHRLFHKNGKPNGLLQRCFPRCELLVVHAILRKNLLLKIFYFELIEFRIIYAFAEMWEPT